AEAMSIALSRRDRTAVFLLLVVIGGLAWAYTLPQAREIAAMDAAMWRDMNMSMNGMAPSWTLVDVVLMVLMWSAMMAAMMLPGSAAMVGAFAASNRTPRGRG